MLGFDPFFLSPLLFLGFFLLFLLFCLSLSFLLNRSQSYIGFEAGEDLVFAGPGVTADGKGNEHRDLSDRHLRWLDV